MAQFIMSCVLAVLNAWYAVVSFDPFPPSARDGRMTGKMAVFWLDVDGCTTYVQLSNILAATLNQCQAPSSMPDDLAAFSQIL
jgi:hypothetical protein